MNRTCWKMALNEWNAKRYKFCIENTKDESTENGQIYYKLKNYGKHISYIKLRRSRRKKWNFWMKQKQNKTERRKTTIEKHWQQENGSDIKSEKEKRKTNENTIVLNRIQTKRIKSKVWMENLIIIYIHFLLFMYV